MQACNELIFELSQFAEKLCAQLYIMYICTKGHCVPRQCCGLVLLHTIDSLNIAVHFATMAGNVPPNIVETPARACSVLSECTKS